MSRLFVHPALALLAASALGSAALAHGHSSGHAGHSGHSTTTSRSSTTTMVSTGSQGRAMTVSSRTLVSSQVRAPGRSATGFVSTRGYSTTYGVQFKRGVFYRGLYHRHWSARHLHPRWRVWFWYDPSTSGWYYWNADKSCFLPTNVIASYPPAVGVQEGCIPPDGNDVPSIGGRGAVPDVPNVPNPEGIE